MRTLFAASLATTAVLVTGVMCAPAASAHAIAELNGDPAYAGRTSVMTLELQHGCLSNNLGIDTVVAYFSDRFTSAKPAQDVSGWRAKTGRAGDGRHKITWTLTGTRPEFNVPTYFPISIGWPEAPGVYGIPVKQKCDSDVNMWNTPPGPATAHHPSPPLYPRPQVKVLAP